MRCSATGMTMPFRRERDQRGDEQVRPVVRPGRPGDGQRQRDRLRGEGVEHGGDALLVEQREARHQHDAGQQVGDLVGVVHASTPRVRNASRMARKPKTKAMPTKSGRRKTRILAMLTSHTPSSAAPASSLAVQAASPIAQPPTPARRRRHAERREQADQQRQVEHQLEVARRLDQGEMAAGIFEHHGLVDHGELEMRRRIVDRDARILGQRHDDQRHQRQRQRHAHARTARR